MSTSFMSSKCRGRRQRRKEELEKKIDGLLENLADSGRNPALVAKLNEFQRELEECRSEVKPSPSYDPGRISALVKRALMNLDGALNGQIDLARAALKDLLAESKLVEEGGQVVLELHTNLDRMLLASEGPCVPSGPRHRFQNVPDT